MGAGNLIARKKEVCSQEQVEGGTIMSVVITTIQNLFKVLMTKRNLIRVLNAPDYKAHVPLLRKLKDYKCALWSKKYSN